MGIEIASGVLAVLVIVAAVRAVTHLRRHEPLGRCPVCTADAVSVIVRDTGDQTEIEAELALRCGACGTWRRITTSPAAAHLLELKLERQCRYMREVAERQERERMASDADAFVAVLRSEIESAEDFLARTQA